MNILLTSAGRRVSLVRAFQKELHLHFSGSKVYGADMNPDLSSACRVADSYFKVPPVSHPSYCQGLVDICLDNNIKLVIPTIDTELLTFADNKSLFSKNGIQIVISDSSVIHMCRNKRKTRDFFNSIGIPVNQEVDIKNPKFPIFAKPVSGSSSIGVLVIRDLIKLSESLESGSDMIYEEYLDPTEHSEYTVDMYFDQKGSLKCAVPRHRIEVRTGEVSKAVTRRDDLYEFICKKFKRCKGFSGCITLQLFKNTKTKEFIGIEINPRFGGGYPLSYHARANYPGFIIREYLKNEKISFFNSWTKDLLMLRYDDEIIINDYKG